MKPRNISAADAEKFVTQVQHLSHELKMTQSKLQDLDDENKKLKLSLETERKENARYKRKFHVLEVQNYGRMYDTEIESKQLTHIIESYGPKSLFHKIDTDPTLIALKKLAASKKERISYHEVDECIDDSHYSRSNDYHEILQNPECDINLDTKTAMILRELSIAFSKAYNKLTLRSKNI